MKKIAITIMLFMAFFACTNAEQEVLQPKQVVPLNLNVLGDFGFRLESNFVTTEAKINVKLKSDEVVTIKMVDLSGKVVSSGELNGKQGDNVFSIYTKSFPRSSYELQLYNSNNQQIGRTLINLL